MATFVFNRRFQAERGGDGKGKDMHGRKGRDVIVKVPCGTLVYNKETGDLLADIDEAGREVVIAVGGRGGRGNARFATPVNRAPREHEEGERCEPIDLVLELKLIAEKIVELIQSSVIYEEICKRVSAYQKRTHTLFSLESLRNLANNGRVSAVTAKFAGALGIRVIGRASEQGQLEPLDKCPGEKRALRKILERMLEAGYSGGKTLIDHCRNLQAAEQLRNMILERFPGAQVRIGENGGLCSFYAEAGGLILGFESA